jgi:hypothetical protein
MKNRIIISTIAFVAMSTVIAAGDVLSGTGNTAAGDYAVVAGGHNNDAI